MSEYQIKNAYEINAVRGYPKVVGYWVLYPQGSPHTKFGVYHKPTDGQIKNTEQLLGWGWEDV